MPANDRAPSVQFYFRDWMSDPSVHALTWDEKGRYHWAWCCTLGTPTPGVALEDQWRRWMGYTPDEWSAHRDNLAACFSVQADGTWVQERTKADSDERNARFAAAQAAGRASARTRGQRKGNGSATEDQRRGSKRATPSSASASSSASAENQEPKAIAAQNARGDTHGGARTPNGNGEDHGAGEDLPPGQWFDECFWPEYPRRAHVSRANARNAMIALFRKTPEPEHEVLAQAIVDGLARYREHVAGKDAEFVKHPDAWIRGRCWETAQ